MQVWKEFEAVLKNTDPAKSASHGVSKTAVLALLVGNAHPRDAQILLMKRTQFVETHKGQICFPGGFHEAEDGDLLITALRETEEEIGVLRKDVQIVGPLPSVLTRNAVGIHPWVGLSPGPLKFVLSTREVDRVFYLPVQKLLEQGLEQVRVDVGAAKVFSLGMEHEGELIWGATARILSHLRDALLLLK